MDLVTFTKEIINGKLHFLCSVEGTAKQDANEGAVYGNIYKRYNIEDNSSIQVIFKNNGAFYFIKSYSRLNRKKCKIKIYHVCLKSLKINSKYMIF